MSRRPPPARRRRLPANVDGLLLALLLAIVVLTALVAGGALSGIDRFALDHAPVHDTADAPSGIRAILVPFHHDQPRSSVVVEAWTFPASVPVSGLLVLVCCGALALRGRRRDALLWATAWIAGNAIEVLGKTAIGRPGLEAGSGLGGLDQSFPSGHAIRAVLAAALLGLIWRRAARPAGGWAVTVLIALIVSGAHTPSDVAGGLLIGLLLALVVHRSARRPIPSAAPRLGDRPPEASPPSRRSTPA